MTINAGVGIERILMKLSLILILPLFLSLFRNSTDDGDLGVPSVALVTRMTGIFPIGEAMTFKVSHYGEELKRNKATLMKYLSRYSDSKVMIAIAMAMCMQESTDFNPGNYDHSKTGDATNYGLFNLNRHLIGEIDSSYVRNKEKLDSLNKNATAVDIESSIAKGAKLVMAGLHKVGGKTILGVEWQFINSMLNFNRGGQSGFISTPGWDCPISTENDKTYDCIGYRVRVASMTYMILQNPKLLTGDTRIDSELIPV